LEPHEIECAPPGASMNYFRPCFGSSLSRVTGAAHVSLALNRRNPTSGSSLKESVELTTNKTGGQVSECNRQIRHFALLPLRISGTDGQGEEFEQLAYTLDISDSGVRLAGIHHLLKSGDTVCLRYHQERAQFEVMWVKQMRGANEWQAGLRCLEPANRLWTLELAFPLAPEHARKVVGEAAGKSLKRHS
jgi:hypothetical protein